MFERWCAYIFLCNNGLRRLSFHSDNIENLWSRRTEVFTKTNYELGEKVEEFVNNTQEIKLLEWRTNTNHSHSCSRGKHTSTNEDNWESRWNTIGNHCSMSFLGELNEKKTFSDKNKIHAAPDVNYLLNLFIVKKIHVLNLWCFSPLFTGTFNW